MILRNGDVISADIKNCRIITIPLGGANISWEAGIVGSCTHNPPVQFGSPNGVFLMTNGHFLVTEINGDWVDEIDTAGHVYWSVNPPGVNYPSDSNQVGPDRYLTVDYSYPGQIVVFNRAGQTLWRYAPTTGAPAELDHPSLAMALPNGDVLLNDDYDDRVVVVDPRTNQIVWQYGHDGVAGSSAGYLDNPDGVDLLPPFSYANRYQPPATLTPKGFPFVIRSSPKCLYRWHHSLEGVSRQEGLYENGPQVGQCSSRRIAGFGGGAGATPCSCLNPSSRTDRPRTPTGNRAAGPVGPGRRPRGRGDGTPPGAWSTAIPPCTRPRLSSLPPGRRPGSPGWTPGC